MVSSVIEIESHHVGSNRVEYSISFDYILLHSILHSLYMIASIERDQSPSKPIQNKAH